MVGLRQTKGGGSPPNRNANTKSLELRIEHKQLYLGLRVSYTPLFEHKE